jgi:hypothetical protein
MRSAQNIEKLIKNLDLSIDTSIEMDRAILGELFEAQENSKKTKPAPVGPDIWRIVMKSRITKLAAAAVIIIAVLIGINHFGGPIDGSSVAYGITDLPELIKKAKTIHMKGWVYFPNTQSGAEMAKLEFEYWFDVENGRYRLYKPGGIDRDTGEPRYYTTVSDGQYIMGETYHRPMSGQPWKSISFTKHSPFKARLEAYKNSYVFLMRMFGHIDQIEGSTKLGREEIDGTVFDIWENEFYFSDGRGTTGTKIKTWLAPDSGDVGRALVWQKRQKDDPNWRLVFDLHTLELDVVTPPGIFNTEPPEDCKLDNTKETARTSGLGVNRERVMRKDYELHTHIGFTLGDGSVIIGWSCRERIPTPQADLFEGLVTGGPLPALAAKIEGLTAIPRKLGVSYRGRHLAYTQKDGDFYEWALYVPDSEPPARGSLVAYELNVKYEVDKSRFGTRHGNLSEDLVIDSSYDFGTWVRGAMAELSDDGKAPEHVTYENVLRLAEQIRNSPGQ